MVSGGSIPPTPQKIKFNIMTVKFNLLELASELADKRLLETFDGNPYTEDENRDTIYTEEAQDYFNDLYDEYTNFLMQLKLDN